MNIRKFYLSNLIPRETNKQKKRDKLKLQTKQSNILIRTEPNKIWMITLESESCVLFYILTYVTLQITISCIDYAYLTQSIHDAPGKAEN